MSWALCSTFADALLSAACRLNGQCEQSGVVAGHFNQQLQSTAFSIDRDAGATLAEVEGAHGLLTMAAFMIPVVITYKGAKKVNQVVKDWVLRLEEFQESLRLQFESSPENADFLLSVSSSSYEWQDHPDYAVLRQFQQETNLKFFCTPLLSSMLYSDTDIQEFVAAGRKTKYGVLCFDPSVSDYQDCSNPFIGHVCMRELVFTAQNPGRTRVYFPSAKNQSKPTVHDALLSDKTIGLMMDTKYFEPSNRKCQDMHLAPELQRLVEFDERWFRLGMTKVADVDLTAGSVPHSLGVTTPMVYVYLFPKPFAPASIVALSLHRLLPKTLVWDIMQFLHIAYYAHISRHRPNSSMKFWSWLRVDEPEH